MLQEQEVSDKTFVLTLDDLPSNVENTSLNNALKIHPNPTYREVFIDADGNFEVEIIDFSGKIISMQKVGGQENLDLGNIPDGVYQARIFSDGKQVSLNKIVKVS